LRTAKKGRKLSTLSNNIKCGNSLIDDPKVAGSKAFNWNEEFKEIMSNGGFDVVIGNPPYVRSRDNLLDNYKDFFYSKYQFLHEKTNLYLLFIERALMLLNKCSPLGFIVPNSWLGMESAYKIRKALLQDYNLKSFVNLIGESFSGVNVETVIFTLRNQKVKKYKINYLTTDKQEINTLNFNTIDNSIWLLNRNYIFDTVSNNVELNVINKIKESKYIVGNVYDVRVGMQAYEKEKGNPPQSEEDVKNHVFDYDYKFDENTHPYLNGQDVGRYNLEWTGAWLRWGKWLSQPKEFIQFSIDRILIREITGEFPRVLKCSFVSEIFLNNKSIINILKSNNNFELKPLLGIINSTLLGFYHKRMAVKGNRSLFPKAVIKDVKNYPIPEINKSLSNYLTKLVNEIMYLNKQKLEFVNKFKHRVKEHFNFEKLSKKLQSFYDYDFKQFRAELKKQKVAISLKQQDEWEEYFNEYKTKINQLQEEITKTDNERDVMVYKLYNLTYEEVKIVDPQFWMSEEEYNLFSI
ncbi:MAG: TaqI-like C-terminal specificity domain-containing protein, partial [Melioribacteraceae bacterium]